VEAQWSEDCSSSFHPKLNNRVTPKSNNRTISGKALVDHARSIDHHIWSRVRVVGCNGSTEKVAIEHVVAIPI